MNHKLASLLIVTIVALLAGSGSVTAQEPQPALTTPLGTAFTYQGRLLDNGNQANGPYDFLFILYDALSGGAQIGSTVSINDQWVSNGDFTAVLDFAGSTFNGEARWLEISVRPGNSTGSYTTLSPRQELTATPYALFSRSAPWSGLTGMPSDFADGVDNDTLYTAGPGLSLNITEFSLIPSFRLPQNCGAGQIPEWNGSSWLCSADDDTLYTAGTGLFLSDTQFNLAPAYRLPLYCANNQVPKWNGSSWLCAADDDTFYTAGTGLILSGNQFNLASSYSLPQSCANNQIPKWNGSSWICGVDDDTTTFWSLSGNSGTDSTINYLGTNDNQALELHVNGMRILRLEPRSVVSPYSAPNLIGGYQSNQITTGVIGAILLGGGMLPGFDVPNIVTDDFGTISGGAGNIAGNSQGPLDDANYATVGGGYSNSAKGAYSTISGGSSNLTVDNYSAVCGGQYNMTTGNYSTVCGGYFNFGDGLYSTVCGGSGNGALDYSTVSGGYRNRALGDYSNVSGGYTNMAEGYFTTIAGGNNNWIGVDGWGATIGGGDHNVAVGLTATIPGGSFNEAIGAYSFAAGADGHATHPGSFVWSSAERTNSYGDQTFTVRAHGGARFYTASGLDTGIQLASGGGSWSSLSDRASKENFRPVDPQSILEQLAQLPIASWNYRSQDSSIRHIGPISQDFYNLFGLGEDDKHITTVDADGIALAAIQGLYQQNQQLQAENAALQVQLSDIEHRLAALESGGSYQAARPFGSWLLLAGLGFAAAIAWRRKAANHET